MPSIRINSNAVSRFSFSYLHRLLLLAILCKSPTCISNTGYRSINADNCSGYVLYLTDALINNFSVTFLSSDLFWDFSSFISRFSALWWYRVFQTGLRTHIRFLNFPSCKTSLDIQHGWGRMWKIWQGVSRGHQSDIFGKLLHCGSKRKLYNGIDTYIMMVVIIFFRKHEK